MSRDDESKLSVYFSAALVYFFINIRASILQNDSCKVRLPYTGQMVTKVQISPATVNNELAITIVL